MIRQDKHRSYLASVVHLAVLVLDILHIFHKREIEIRNRSELFFIKNQMIIGSLIANILGVLLVVKVIFRDDFWLPVPGFECFIGITVYVVTPLAFGLGTLLTLIYERPVRIFFDRYYLRKDISPELRLQARRKLLNEPFFIIALDAGIWLAAGLAIAVFLISQGLKGRIALLAFFRRPEYRTHYLHPGLLHVGTHRANAPVSIFIPRRRPVQNPQNPSYQNRGSPFGPFICL